MIPPADIHRIAIVGSGLIGASWAAHFLGRGLDVTVTDPAPDAATKLRAAIERAWPAVAALGLAPGASRDRLRFTPDLAEALRDTHFVQENGPERLELKRALFAQIDALVPPEVLIATSSSGLTMSEIQTECRHPERCVIGHPFNPPHLIPLVEIVGGKATAPAAIEAARAFYLRVGKKPVVLRREVPGHAANRLQAALWREAVHLVEQGVLSVEDVDTAVCEGPGLRWALMGPHLTLHLGGGAGGLEHFLAHLAGPFSRWWDDLGEPVLTAELKARLVAGVQAEAAGRTVAELERRRDTQLVRLLSLRAEPPPPAS